MAVSYMTKDGYDKILAENQLFGDREAPEISAQMLRRGIRVT